MKNEELKSLNELKSIYNYFAISLPAYRQAGFAISLFYFSPATSSPTHQLISSSAHQLASSPICYKAAIFKFDTVSLSLTK
jgi:hypothetical protein